MRKVEPGTSIQAYKALLGPRASSSVPGPITSPRNTGPTPDAYNLVSQKYNTGTGPFEQNLTRDNLTPKSIGLVGELRKDPTGAPKAVMGEYSIDGGPNSDKSLGLANLPITGVTPPALGRWDTNTKKVTSDYVDIPSVTPNQTRSGMQGLLNETKLPGVVKNADDSVSNRGWQGKKPFTNWTESTLKAADGKIR